MKRYEIKSGLNAGLDGVRTDKRSALGQALGYADIKWRLLLDPDYSPNGVPFDRVNGRLTAASVPIPRGNFANGAAAFNLISNTQVQPNVAFNNTAWSMFWVCRLSTATSGQLARTITGVSGQLSPRLSFSSSAVNFGLYQGETATFRSSALLSSGFTNVTTLLMVTFSATGGLKVFRDGVLAGDNPTEVGVFDIGYRAGEWQMFNAMRGLVGICGLTDTDLGSTAMAAYRIKIEQFLKAKYGIA